MDNKKSKRMIAAGFGTMLSIIIFMTAVWVSHIVENTKRLQEIVLEHEESEYVFQMRDAAYDRAIALHRMALIDDPFERDDEYMEFKTAAEGFIKSRDKLLNHNLTQEEQRIWDRAKPLVMQGLRVQSEAVRKIIDESDMEASNAADAEQAVMNYQPDLLFLDIEMPDKNGIEVLKHIKKIQPDCFVIMVSGHSTFENLQDAMDHGAASFIVKPYTRKKLEQVVKLYQDQIRAINTA